MSGISAQITLPRPTLAPSGEALARLIGEFLAWLELNKGLRLCEAYKPQYDWYVPIPTNAGTLALEFLEGSAVLDQEKHA